MTSWRLLLAFLFLLLTFIHVSHGVIHHCDPKTDQKREAFLKDHPGLKEFLEKDETTNGRLGLIHLVSWQDTALMITGPEGVKCTWKMRSAYKKSEEKNFNKRHYTSHKLRADGLNARRYIHLVSCESDTCVQHYNVILRPIAKPDFPVQVYTSAKVKVHCTLKFMDDHEHDFSIEHYKPPFRFEWTGPRFCKKKDWDSNDPNKCRRYAFNGTIADCSKQKECKLKIDQDYKNTHIIFKTKKYGNEMSMYESTLVIDDADVDHNGKWRCLVYDKFGISSHPEDTDPLLEAMPRGVAFIHVKDLALAIGIPLAAMGTLLLLTILCICFCKQCTDFDAKALEKEEEQAKLKESKSKAASKSSKAASQKNIALAAASGDNDKKDT